MTNNRKQNEAPFCRLASACRTGNYELPTRGGVTKCANNVGERWDPGRDNNMQATLPQRLTTQACEQPKTKCEMSRAPDPFVEARRELPHKMSPAQVPRRGGRRTEPRHELQRSSQIPYSSQSTHLDGPMISNAWSTVCEVGAVADEFGGIAGCRRPRALALCDRNLLLGKPLRLEVFFMDESLP